MLDVIETKIEAFKFLCEKCYCEFSCALFMYTDTEESTPWVHLDSRYNGIVKELNIEFDVDIYLLFIGHTCLPAGRCNLAYRQTGSHIFIRVCDKF